MDIDINKLLDRKQIVLESNKIKSFIHNKTVLVTGGGGSIGSELCRQIARYQPEKIVIFDISWQFNSCLFVILEIVFRFFSVFVCLLPVCNTLSASVLLFA